MAHATPDELTKPLGIERAQRRAVRPPAKAARLMVRSVAALAAGCVAVIAGYVSLLGDPLGGDPHAVVTIVRKEAAPKGDQKGAEKPRNSSNADELERQAGVSVVRGGEAGAPSAVIISVPERGPIKLMPAPDRRLVERTRHGLLPKVAADGTKASAVYARPVEELAGGAKPAGRIAIVVGGLGIGQSITNEAIGKLAPAVTLAFAPYGTDLEGFVGRARDHGHEVLLHVPMQPFDYPDNDPGPLTLTAEAKPADNIDRLHRAMTRFSGYVGAINYMGAKLTSSEGALAPILKELGDRGLLFLDDGSSPRSLAVGTAQTTRTKAGRADVVIDAVQRPEAIDKELERLEALAQERGLAIGTASALPLSIDRIARWTRSLEDKGLVLMPVSAAIGDGPAR